VSGVGHLDELYAKYKDRGLVVISVTDEARGLVDKFIEKTGAKHPIVIEKGSSADDYGITGFPSMFLIDANGRIAVAGNPQESDIERLLPEAWTLPVLPKKLDAARKPLEKGDMAGARKALDAALAGTGLEEADRTAAGEAVKWIDGRGAKMLAAADADAKAGDAHAAAATLRKAAESFKGLEAGAKADEALKALLAGKDTKREIDAGDVWDKLRDKFRTMKPDQAAAACRQVEKKYEGTKAAAKAAAAAGRFEAMGKGH
jgi:redoxin